MRGVVRKLDTNARPLPQDRHRAAPVRDMPYDVGGWTVAARLSVAACSMWLMDMAQRRGLFWDVLEGRVPPPPAAVLLGWELIGVDPEQGTIEVAFEAGDQFANPVGVIQGGFLAAMLDDTLGPALVATLPENQFAPTLDLHVQFLRPARPGRLVGRGRSCSAARTCAFSPVSSSDLMAGRWLWRPRPRESRPFVSGRRRSATA